MPRAEKQIWAKILGYRIGDRIRVFPSRVMIHTRILQPGFEAKEGSLGTIIEILKGPPPIYLIKFDDGLTYWAIEEEVELASE